MVGSLLGLGEEKGQGRLAMDVGLWRRVSIVGGWRGVREREREKKRRNVSFERDVVRASCCQTRVCMRGASLGCGGGGWPAGVRL